MHLKVRNIDVKLGDLSLLSTFYTQMILKAFKKKLLMIPDESEPGRLRYME